MQVRVGVKGEALQQGAPGLLSGKGPDVHLRPAQPLPRGVTRAGPFELPGESAEVLFTDEDVASLSKSSGAWRTTLPGRSTGIWRPQ